MRSIRRFLARTDALWAAACLVLGLLLGVNPWVRTWEWKGLDLSFRSHRNLETRPFAGPEIAIVGIDEESTRRISEPLALYHRPLGQFLEAMAEARPAAVGLDIVLPERSWDHLLPGSDAALVQGIIRLRRVAPLVLGRTVGVDGIPRPIHRPFEVAAGTDRIGFVQVVPDEDQAVRRFETRLGLGGVSVPTLAGRLAETFGRQPEPGLVNFTLGKPYTYVPLHQVLDWQASGATAALHTAFQGKIVLLGSVTPYEDRITLPAPLAAWEPRATRDSPAILLQAQTLGTLLSNAVISPMPGWMQAIASMLAALGGMLLARSSRKGVVILVAAHVLLPLASWVLLGWKVHLPFVAALAALDGAYLLTAQRRARRRIEAESLERRVLERALLDTAERERQSVGHELHDGVCQQISGALLRCRVVERTLASRKAPEVEHLRAMADMLDASLRDAHELAQGLSPGELDPGTVASAIQELARRVRENFEAACEYEDDGCGTRVDGPAATQLYRITQEAVTNALKHGNPSTIWIDLRQEGQTIRLTVENDGRDLSEGRPQGMGQRIMRYRAELIGGRITLDTRKGGGVRLVCTIPVSAENTP